MSKTVLLFPGQASQYVGMGKDLYKESDKVRKLYELASDEIGVDIAKLSFAGPSEELKKTRFTQPAILVHALSVLTILDDRIPEFDFACGHSLGEYAALAAVGSLTFADAIKSVVKRASLMEDACQNNPGTMAAIMGLAPEKVIEICEMATDNNGVVIPANYNSKIQIVISGSVGSVETAVILAKEAKAKRAMLLEVGGAFHSPLMESAKIGMEAYLQTVTISNPQKPIVANVTAQTVLKANEIQKLLVQQITSPVKWAQTMSFLVENSVSTVYEIGPGKVLSGLAKREMRPERMINLDTLEDITKLNQSESLI